MPAVTLKELLHRLQIGLINTAHFLFGKRSPLCLLLCGSISLILHHLFEIIATNVQVLVDAHWVFMHSTTLGRLRRPGASIAGITMKTQRHSRQCGRVRTAVAEHVIAYIRD